MSLRKNEIIAQAKALKAMHGDDMALIDELAPVLRKIINQVEAETDKVPTVDEIIWLASEAVGRNLRKES